MHKQMREQTTIVMNGGQRINSYHSVLLKAQRSDASESQTSNPLIPNLALYQLSHCAAHDLLYSTTCVKRPLKNRQNKGLYDS